MQASLAGVGAKWISSQNDVTPTSISGTNLVAAAVIQSPWREPGLLSGLELSPVVSYNTGHPFNLLAGADINVTTSSPTTVPGSAA